MKWRRRRKQTESEWSRFSSQAREALVVAQHVAITKAHDSIACELILLGIALQPSCSGALLLIRLGVDYPAFVGFLLRDLQPVAEAAEIGLSLSAKQTIELAIDEAERMGDVYIGTQHLVLAGLRTLGTSEVLPPPLSDFERTRTLAGRVPQETSSSPYVAAIGAAMYQLHILEIIEEIRERTGERRSGGGRLPRQGRWSKSDLYRNS